MDMVVRIKKKKQLRLYFVLKLSIKPFWSTPQHTKYGLISGSESSSLIMQQHNLLVKALNNRIN